MRLRKLEEKDIPFMLEWMHDKELVKYMSKDFSNFTAESQKEYIKNSFDDKNQNFAVVSDDDEYLGGISLKNIDSSTNSAEYAICLRRKCIGTKTAYYATMKLLDYAFNKLCLNRIYLYVITDNIRADKFYKKVGFILEGEFKEAINIRGTIKDVKFYRMLKREYNNKN